MGNGNYVYVWSSYNNPGIENENFFSVANVSQIGTYGSIFTNAGMTVRQAYSIDAKVDDGLPQSGRIYAFYDGGSDGGTWPAWAGNTTNNGGTAFTTATVGSPTTCFDNDNTTGAPQRYSMEQNGGTGLNCALSFRFQ